MLVGLNEQDDAAVWRLDDERALAITTDFFPPVVDTPYEYGVIAAANSLSDIYAMGGEPFLALNITATPPGLPLEIVSEILRGGAQTARDAGVVIAGGHTIQDEEPKYGLIVLGFVHPDRILTKAGAMLGDHLIMTKPLGFGVTTTALKQGKAEDKDIQEAIEWMSLLNRTAAQMANEFELCAGTDITGFSLLGHAWEMAEASGVGLQIEFDSVPFISCARKYAEEWTFPGGSSDNRLYFAEHVEFAKHIDEASQMLLFDAQTSGGLLLSVPVDKLEQFLERAGELDQPVWDIGQVVAGNKISVE